jgi:hypothetical protein
MERAANPCEHQYPEVGLAPAGTASHFRVTYAIDITRQFSL